jgi:hypothetical protein
VRGAAVRHHPVMLLHSHVHICRKKSSNYEEKFRSDRERSALCLLNEACKS